MAIGVAIIVVLIGLVLVVVVIGASYPRLKWQFTIPRITEPRCGNCGYIVRGITTLTCPECGGDLREAGIVTGRLRRPSNAPAILFCVLWTILLAPVAVMITAGVDSALPHWSLLRHSARMQAPKSGTYESIAISAAAMIRLEAAPSSVFLPSDATIELLTLTGKSSVMTADLRTGACSYKTAAGTTVRPPGKLDGAAVLDWMHAAGVDTTGPGVMQEAVEVCEVLREQPGGYLLGNAGSNTSSGTIYRHFDHGSSAWSGERFHQPWIIGLCALFWLALWLAGLRWIMRGYGPARSFPPAGSGA